jgi:WD40 repeat protein/uncharacterized caspase-like protein
MAPARISTSQASRALETGEAKLWALLVGVNQYQDKQLPPLRYPAMDCQGLGSAIATATALFPRKAVTLHCTGGTHPADGPLAIPKPPQLKAVLQSLTDLVAQAQPQDTVLIYVSGHGVLDGGDPPQAVLCLEDTRLDALETSGLRLKTLLDTLNQCLARHQLLWLDACHSGSLSLRGSKDVTPVRPDPTPWLIDVLRQRARQSQGFYALLSCDQQQRSWEFPELGHGVFSYFLMRGLLGEAANAEGVVEADALYKYVYYQTLRYIDTTNQQLRLINQQRRHRGEANLLSEYPLQTPKRIVEGVGELVLGVATAPVATFSPRQAIMVTPEPPGPELLSLSQQLQRQGGFALHYWWPGQGEETVQTCLDRLLGKGPGTAPGLDLAGTVFLYLQGTPEQTTTGEPLLRLGDEVQISRSWLRQRLRHAPHGQQIVILNSGRTDNLAEWVEDLQLNADHSQAILAGSIPSPEEFVSLLQTSLAAPEPATGLSIAGWIAQLQRHMADADGVLHTWLSSPKVIDVLLGQRADRGIADPSPVDLGICPYRGLQAFQVADAPYFFGRETLTQHLVNALHRQSLLAVVGASGSGKSSVVQAGLMATLRQGQQIPDSNRWWLGYLRPGEQPLNALVNALIDPGTEREQFYQQQQIEGLLHQGPEGFVQWLRSRPEPMVVLVIDQFEELFSLAAECDRAPFLSLLLGGLEHASDRFKLVLTLRSDFMATALENATLATLLPSATVLVPPVLNPDDYRQIILNPAEKVGLQVEPALVDVLLRDLDRGIGNLPLLEFVLEQIWLQRDSGTLRLQTYQQTVGGLEGALERKAQAVYDSLDPEAQDCARWLFLSLTHLGDGTDDTRRRLPRTALTIPRYPAALIDRTLQTFITAKLIIITTEDIALPHQPQPKSTPDPTAPLTSPTSPTSLTSPTSPTDHPTPYPSTHPPIHPSTHPPTLEVAHEILIRRWSTLRWWLDENRTRLRSQRQLEQSAQQWHNSGQQPEYLLQGVRLEAATELYVKYTDELAQPVQEFVEACLATQQQEQKRERQQLRRARMAVGAISGLALVALGLGGLAFRQQQRALASEIAALNALATAQEQSHQPLESLITSIQAGQQLQRLNGFGLGRQVRASHQVHTLTTLYRAVTQTSERNRLQGQSQPVNRAVLSPDGSRIASASDDGTVRLWASDGELLQVWEGSGERFTDVAFHPDGNLLAAASADGSIWLWQPETEADPTVFTAHPDWVSRLTFSPDGTLMATASRDGTVRLWQTTNQQLLRTLSGHQGWVNTVQFSPDGQQVASGGEDGTVRIWDASTGRPLAALRPGNRGQNPLNGQAPDQRNERINDLAFSPSGEFLVSASDDQTLGIWAFSDNSLTVLDTGNRRSTSVQVSPDSQLILAGTSDGTLQLWRVSSQEVVAQLAGHSGAVPSVAFAAPLATPEGPQVPQQVSLISAGADNTIRLWTTPVVADAPQAADPSSYPIAPHPDGQTYAIGGWDGTVVLQSPTQRQTLSGHSGSVLALAFSATGNWLASGGDEGTIRLWEGDTGRAEQTLTGHQGRITSLAFSPDERQLLSGSADQTAILWDLTTGQPLHTLTDHPDEVTAVAWGPRGNVIATGSVDGTINLWRPNGQPLHTLDGHDLEIAALAFSPDGKRLASSGWDRTLRLWRVGDGTLLQTLTNPQDTAVRLQFTPDGYTLLTEDRYGQTQVWNPANGQLLTTFAPNPATLIPQLTTEDGAVLQPPLALGQQLNQPEALSELLEEGCDRIADYLQTNTTLDNRDRALCNL